VIRRLIQRIGRPESEPPWGVLTALGSAVAAFAAVVIGATLATSLLGDTPFAVIAGWTLGMVLIAVYVIATHTRTPEQSAAMRLEASRLPVLIAVLLGISAGIALDLVGLIVTGVGWPLPELLPYFAFAGDVPVIADDVSVLAWMLAGLFLLVFQPVGEGLVFRGVAYPALRSSLGAWAGFLMTAVFQAVFHLVAYAPPGGGSSFTVVWYSLILPFLMALFLAGIRAYTGSTRTSILAQAGLGMFFLAQGLLFGT
jgi:membrane protease YdiL (CAAX protease family)